MGKIATTCLVFCFLKWDYEKCPVLLCSHLCFALSWLVGPGWWNWNDSSAPSTLSTSIKQCKFDLIIAGQTYKGEIQRVNNLLRYVIINEIISFLSQVTRAVQDSRHKKTSSISFCKTSTLLHILIYGHVYWQPLNIYSLSNCLHPSYHDRSWHHSARKRTRGRKSWCLFLQLMYQGDLSCFIYCSIFILCLSCRCYLNECLNYILDTSYPESLSWVVFSLL